jgi:undecaprenyl-diphosphatase
MLEHLNLTLFSSLNANAGLAGWRLSAALFTAEWLILLVPATLVMLWIGGVRAERQAAVRACLAAGCALAVNAVLGLLWFHPRPFMAGVGHTFLHHAPDSSFPSDHATILFAVALVLAAAGTPRARQAGWLLMPVSLAVAWSRVFLGVHFPMDMLGALVVAGSMALLVHAPAATQACAALVTVTETLYRRLLAAPIARGWLRP